MTPAPAEQSPPKGFIESNGLRQKCLIVSCSLPPALNGSASVISNLAMPFSADELLLAGEEVSGELDAEWFNPLSGRPQIVFIHRQWPWRFKRTFRLLVSPIIFFRLLRAYRSRDCRQILAVFPDEFYLFLAWMASIVMRCPLSSYFHNSYLDNRYGIRHLFACWIQPLVFRRSKAIFVMSDAMNKEMTARYSGIQFTTLVHSHNQIAGNAVREKQLSAAFRMAVMGNMNESNQDAFSRLPAVLQEFPHCQLTICSKLPICLFKKVGLAGDQVKVVQAPEPISMVLGEFDLLFLPHGFVGGLTPMEYRTIFPTRTIPYLLSGTPIVAHAPGESYLAEWLKKHDCAEVVDVPSSEAICNVIKRLQGDALRRQQLVRNALSAVEQFDAKFVAEKFRGVLNRNPASPKPGSAH